jgi:hypothetical protein
MATYPPELEQYVQQKLANGEFRDREEFAVEAARLYRELEIRHQQLKDDIQAAIEESDRGESRPLDIEAIKRQIMEEFDEHGQPR